VQSVLIGLALAMPAMLFLAVIGFVFPPTLVVVGPLELLVATVALAWDMCDLPMSIRGLPVKTRIRWLRSHQAAVLGFGFSCALVQFVPVLNLLLLPAALLGSTRLVWDIEQRELRSGRALRGASSS
jgi:CysZ protein